MTKLALNQMSNNSKHNAGATIFGYNRMKKDYIVIKHSMIKGQFSIWSANSEWLFDCEEAGTYESYAAKHQLRIVSLLNKKIN